MTTVENNRLIADFMGVLQYDKLVVIENIPIHIDNAKYHFFWDWLMPVVEKIEATESVDTDELANEAGTILNAGIKQCWRVTTFDTSCKIDFASNFYGWTEFTEIKSETKIEAVYQAVTQFIQWYNQNKSA